MKKLFPVSSIIFQILLPFVLSYLSQRLSIGRGYQLNLSHLNVILVNYFLWSIFFLFFISLFKKNYRSITAYLIFFFIFTIANRYKIKFINQPLKFNDFFLGRQLIGFVPLVISRGNITKELIAGFLVLISSIFGIKKIFKSKNPPKIIRFLFFIITILILIFPINFPNRFENILRKNNLNFYTWDAAENCRNNGIMLCFIYDFKYLKHQAPDDYSQSNINKIYNDIKIPESNKSTSAEKPNIIVILSESLWDATKLSNIKYSSDPIKNIRSDIKSSFISPSFGSETANVEFELLTGLSNYFLDINSYPYTQYIKRNMPSLFTLFKENGYTTTGFHPYSPWFYNRNNIYKYFGVDRFTNLSNMSGYENAGPFVSEKSFINEIINQINSTDQPQFIFALSIQNHPPYEANRFSEHPITLKSELSLNNQQTFQSYIDGINLVDKYYQVLKNELNKTNKPTIVILFGDHLPSLGGNFNIYKDTYYLPSDDSSWSIEDKEKMATTPLTVWSNFETNLEIKKHLSPNFLSLEVLKLANITPKYQFSFLNSLSKTESVLNRKFFTNLSSEQLKNYELIQYDLIFGKQYGLK